MWILKQTYIFIFPTELSNKVYHNIRILCNFSLVKPCGRAHMLIGFTTTYTIGAYQN